MPVLEPATRRRGMFVFDRSDRSVVALRAVRWRHARTPPRRSPWPGKSDGQSGVSLAAPLSRPFPSSGLSTRPTYRTVPGIGTGIVAREASRGLGRAAVSDIRGPTVVACEVPVLNLPGDKSILWCCNKTFLSCYTKMFHLHKLIWLAVPYIGFPFVYLYFTNKREIQ